MIARLYIQLPFSFFCPEGDIISPIIYHKNGYKICLFPPQKTNQPTIENDSYEVIVNKMHSFRSDFLKIDFIKEIFNRQIEKECDPPIEFIEQTVNSFILKYRFVSKGVQINTIRLSQSSWKIQYLNDDETELTEGEGLVRGRFGKNLHYTINSLTSNIWNNIRSLSVDFLPPEWDNLYLNALKALPDIGVAIVLTSISLEIFISSILDKLAQNPTIPSDLWYWVNNRGIGKAPTSEEQYDNLLHILLGASLKEEPILWQAFLKIKKARNSFVHEGIAKIENKPLVIDEAIKLIHQSSEIINFIKTKLPDNLQWLEFQNVATIEIRGKLNVMKKET